MRKYYFITLFAIISIAILQVYNITLQYKEYCNNNIGYLTDVLKKSLDEEFALRTQHNHQKIKNQGSQRFYYQRISKEELKKIKHTTKNVVKMNEINIQELRKRGIVESQGEAMNLLSRDVVAQNGNPLDFDKLMLLLKKNLGTERAFALILMDGNGKVLKSNQQRQYMAHWVAGKPVAIGLSPLLFAKIYVDIPISKFLVNSLGTLCATLFMALFVIFVVGFQVRVIRSKENLLKERETCIHGTVHDLKTPLASVLLLLSFIKDNVKEKELSELLSKAECQIQKLADTVKTLLITAKAGESKLILNKEKVNLLTLVDNVKNDVEIAFADQPHVFIIKDHRTVHQVILADKLLISNVLRNLIENAVKYSDINTEIEVSIDDNLQSVFVSVKDNGVGIERKYQKKIFEQFFRISSTQNKSGYGIGLALVKYAMKAHGGSVKVESELGKGSTFVISLPKDKC